MAYVEQFESREVTAEREGVTGQRIWVCTWSERLTASGRPKIGQVYPDTPGLYCNRINYKGIGQGDGGTGYTYCRVTADYSTYQKIDDPFRESIEFSGEALETALGRTWADTNTPVEQAFAVIYPTMTRTYTIVQGSINTYQILQCVGRINYWPFQGGGQGQYLYEGASSDTQYDSERRIYVYRVSHRFIWRGCNHNVVWRAPRQRRDASGNFMWDADGYPLYENGLAGQGAWTATIPRIYKYADFGPLLGLPAKPVPGGGDPMDGLGGDT